MNWLRPIILVFGFFLGISPVQAPKAPVSVPVAQVVQATHTTKTLPIKANNPQISTTTELIALTNKDREVPLNVDPILMKAAQYRAEYFCTHKLEHFGPNGQNPWDYFTLNGYDYKDAAENLASGWATPQDMETAFMNSPEHKVNIVNPKYTDIGVGWACGNTVVFFGDE